MAYSIIGQSVTKVDARDKVTGEARYAGDIRLSGALHGAILTSPVPHARIVGVDTSEAESLAGVAAVVTAQDALPGRIGLFIRDRTPLASGKVRCIGEPVAAVAATDQATAELALSLIKVTYEKLPAVFDPMEALQPGAPIIHEELSSYFDPAPSQRHGNVRNEVRYAWGDVEAALSAADLVHEESYTTQAVYPGCIEPRSVVAAADLSGKITLWCSTKSPFVLRSQVAQTLGLPISKVRVVAPAVGGDYGGKGPPMIEPICALLARKSGHPVRIDLSRREEFVLGHVRHPTTIKLKTGMQRDGTLLAVQGEIVYDSGAYSNGVMGLAFNSYNLIGPYKIKAADVIGRTVYTNNMPAGHVRAPGAPQPLFAIESQIDAMARTLGLDPWKVRLLNAVDEGSTATTGRGILRHVGLKQCLRRASKAAANLLVKDGPYQGIGMACGQWEVTLQEAIMPSMAILAVNEDGSATLQTGITDQGAGQNTAMVQIAAEVLGLSMQDIAIVSADTDATPYEFSTAASAATTRAGNSVRFAAEHARDQLLALASERLEAKQSDLVLKDRQVFVLGAPDKRIAVAQLVRDAIGSTGGPVLGTSVLGQKQLLASKRAEHGSIDSPSYGVQAAKIRVDPETGNIELEAYIAAQDAGFALNPACVEGQLEGSVAHGLGYASTEETTSEAGRSLVSNLSDYRLPTATDVPDIAVTIVEEPSSFGPFGMKGVGEAALVPVPAVIANAIEDAIGVRLTELPITPQKVLEALRRKNRFGN